MVERPEALAPQPWMQATPTRAVVAALEAAGGPDAARFVGGCVRDALLQVARPDVDIDIATPLPPPEVMAALKRAGLGVVPTGVEHGTVTAIAERRPFEITTLRRDVETDGRRAVVAFTTDWGEDARRRDFRLNALYAEPGGRLHDPTGGGIDDALAGRIVFVGDPETRIREDYLRILRFFRFRAWYGKDEADEAALAACARLSDGLATLSGERVAKELLKLLAAEDPLPSVDLMVNAGVAARLLPHPTPTRLHRLVAVERALGRPSDPVLRLAALDGGDPGALAARLRLSNAQRDRLAAAAPALPEPATSPEAERRLLYGLGRQAFTDRLLLGASPADAPALNTALAQAAGWTRPALPVTGADIKAAGVAEGPEVGRVRRAVETWWIAHDFPADPAAARAALATAIAGSSPPEGRSRFS